MRKLFLTEIIYQLCCITRYRIFFFYFLLYSKPSTSDNGKEKQKSSEKSKKKKTPSASNEGVVNPIYDEDNMAEFSMGDVDTDMFPDDQFQVTMDTNGGATSMSNPLYRDPFMDEDSPLSSI